MLRCTSIGSRDTRKSGLTCADLTVCANKTLFGIFTCGYKFISSGNLSTECVARVSSHPSSRQGPH